MSNVEKEAGLKAAVQRPPSAGRRVKPGHLAPPDAWLAQSVKTGCVIPCQVAGCYAFNSYHKNTVGAIRGFRDDETYKKYHADQRVLLADYSNWEEVDLTKLDPAWTTTYGNVGGRGFTLTAIKPKLVVVQKEMVEGYGAAAETARSQEPTAFKDLESNPNFASSPSGTPWSYQTDDCKDPQTGLFALYRGAIGATGPLWEITVAVGKAGNATVKAWNVKTAVRLFDKASSDPEHGFAGVQDVARASVVFRTCADLAVGLLYLKQHHGHQVTWWNNRFAKPCFGYRDFLVNLRVQDHICELQLHLEPMYNVKQGAGHAAYGWLRLLRAARGDATKAENVYEGDYKDGKMHGKGTYKYATGSVYEGDWKDDEKHGKGTYKYANGEVYEGNWKDGNMHGKGTLKYATGDVYEGDYKDNKMHGKGTYKYATGIVLKDGNWKDGNMQLNIASITK